MLSKARGKFDFAQSGHGQIRELNECTPPECNNALEDKAADPPAASCHHADVIIAGENIFPVARSDCTMSRHGGAGSGTPMHFVAKSNVDHYIGLLNDNDLTSNQRTVITKLLIVEEDKLAFDLDHLEFAETRAAQGRERLIRLRNKRNGHPVGTIEREQAEGLLISCENLQTALEDFCHRLRAQVNTRGL
jgi:hypothetical protein